MRRHNLKNHQDNNQQDSIEIHEYKESLIKQSSNQLSANLPTYYSLINDENRLNTEFVERVIEDIDDYLNHLTDTKIHFDKIKQLRKELLERIDEALATAITQGHDKTLFYTYGKIEEKLGNVCLGHKVSPSRLFKIMGKTLDDVKKGNVFIMPPQYAQQKKKLEELEAKISDLELSTKNNVSKNDFDKAVQASVLAFFEKLRRPYQVENGDNFPLLLGSQEDNSSSEYEERLAIKDQQIKAAVEQRENLENQNHELQIEINSLKEEVKNTHKTVPNSIPTIAGLQYQEVPGDDHCLYHAVGLYSGENHIWLRRYTAMYLEQHLDEFEASIELPRGKTINDYLQAVRSGHEWATHVEIEILMRVLDRPIMVITANGRITNSSDAKRFSGDPIFVYYNGSTHYDAFTLLHGSNGREILNTLLTLPPIAVDAKQQLIQFNENPQSTETAATSRPNVNILGDSLTSALSNHSTVRHRKNSISYSNMNSSTNVTVPSPRTLQKRFDSFITKQSEDKTPNDKEIFSKCLVM